MEAACAEAQDLGYFPAYFLEKMHRIGALKYAKELVRSGELQSGLRRLKKIGRLDLSLEHFIARVPEFIPLFNKNERDAAEWRLQQIETEK